MCNEGKHWKIDSCLLDILNEINSSPFYKTLLSCCGHGIYPRTIVVLDKRSKKVFEWFSGKQLPRRYKNGKIRKRYYRKDKKGFYYLDGSN